MIPTYKHRCFHNSKVRASLRFQRHATRKTIRAPIKSNVRNLSWIVDTAYQFLKSVLNNMAQSKSQNNMRSASIKIRTTGGRHSFSVPDSRSYPFEIRLSIVQLCVRYSAFEIRRCEHATRCKQRTLD